MAQISGAASADILVGTDASDVFTGGAGHDIIQFNGQGGAQTDIVLDFGAIYFGGPITGAQEVPSNASAGGGTFSGWLNRAQTEFNFFAAITGLDLGGQTAATSDNVTASHFHRGPPGVAGPVIFGFIGLPNNELQAETVVNAAAGTVTGSWDLGEGNNTTLAAELPSLLAGQIYINFHTPVVPTGEIRGQAVALDAGLDRIDVSGLGVGDFDTLKLLMTETGGSTSITAMWNGAANVLTLQGVPMARLSAADFIFATTGRTQFGTAGADMIFGGSGGDYLIGEAGNDSINAGGGADVVEARDGDDTVLGMAGDDAIYGGAGADDLNGNTGADFVDGGDGADTVRGGQDNDTVYGGAGDDPHVNGNMGADVVHGGDGNDTVYGGQGDDTVYGDQGADLISGDLGSDILYGGAGADRFVLRAGFGQDWAADFNAAEGDRIQLAPGATYTVVAYQGQAVITLSGGASIGLAGVAASSFSTDWVVFG